MYANELSIAKHRLFRAMELDRKRTRQISLNAAAQIISHKAWCNLSHLSKTLTESAMIIQQDCTDTHHDQRAPPGEMSSAEASEHLLFNNKQYV